MEFEIGKIDPEELLGPPRIDGTTILLQTLAAGISGIVGGGLMFALTFFLGRVEEGFENLGSFIIAMGGFLMCFCVGIINSKLFHLIDPEKNKYSRHILAPIFFLSLFLYIIITPLYFVLGSKEGESILWVFTFHILLGITSQSIVSEILSGYRYSLIGVGATLAGLTVSSCILLAIFANDNGTLGKLYLLLGVIFITNITIYTIKNIFLWFYYLFYKATGMDPFGNILGRILEEEKRDIENVQKSLQSFH